MTGPFETEREAMAALLWATHGQQAGGIRSANLADLAAECGAAGVDGRTDWRRQGQADPEPNAANSSLNYSAI